MDSKDLTVIESGDVDTCIKQTTSDMGSAVDETKPVDAQGTTEEKPASVTCKASTSPPKRPLTRSQTGVVLKRRPRDDSDTPADLRKRQPVHRKRQKVSSESPATEGADTEPQTSSSSSSPIPPDTRDPSLGPTASRDPPASNTPELTFYHASPVSDDQAECRLPRSRATLPTPIPNLTKKSRGRRVPTQDSNDTDSDQKKDTRLYVCKVEGCGKCFHRGEHLKRHIRSIHTHEKPFKCTYYQCEKYFNRHDNLLQHLKVHREPVTKNPGSPQSPPSPLEQRSETPPRLRNHSYATVEEPDSPVSPTSPRTIYHHLPQTSFNAYAAPVIYSSTTEPISLITNMAVSSLRTEMPHSPTETRQGVYPAQSITRQYQPLTG